MRIDKILTIPIPYRFLLIDLIPYRFSYQFLLGKGGKKRAHTVNPDNEWPGKFNLNVHKKFKYDTITIKCKYCDAPA